MVMVHWIEHLGLRYSAYYDMVSKIAKSSVQPLFSPGATSSTTYFQAACVGVPEELDAGRRFQRLMGQGSRGHIQPEVIVKLSHLSVESRCKFLPFYQWWQTRWVRVVVVGEG